MPVGVIPESQIYRQTSCDLPVILRKHSGIVIAAIENRPRRLVGFEIDWSGRLAHRLILNKVQNIVEGEGRPIICSGLVSKLSVYLHVPTELEVMGLNGQRQHVAPTHGISYVVPRSPPSDPSRAGNVDRRNCEIRDGIVLTQCSRHVETDLVQQVRRKYMCPICVAEVRATWSWEVQPWSNGGGQRRYTHAIEFIVDAVVIPEILVDTAAPLVPIPGSRITDINVANDGRRVRNCRRRIVTWVTWIRRLHLCSS